jgi:hypothetical protein
VAGESCGVGAEVARSAAERASVAAAAVLSEAVMNERRESSGFIASPGNCELRQALTFSNMSSWHRSRCMLVDRADSKMSNIYSVGPCVPSNHGAQIVMDLGTTACGRFGRGGGDRTHDLRLKRPLLYH